MAPSVVIDIRNETIKAIQQDDGQKVDLLIADIEHANDTVISLLKNYAIEKDHHGQVYTYNPIKTLHINEDGHGGLTLFFPINVFNGCRDINIDFNEKVHVTIDINFERKKAILTGEALMPIREPDDC